MNDDAGSDPDGQRAVAAVIARLRAERDARPGHSVFFTAIGDVGLRRQVLRWIGADRDEVTPGILEALRSGLADEDWEVRVTAVLVAARLRARALRSAVRDVALPSAQQFGLTDHDARLLLALREIAAEALAVPDDEDMLASLDRRLGGVPLDLARRILGESVAVRDRQGLLLHALSTPAALAHALPDPPPAAIEMHGRQAMLGGACAMAWVSALPHLLGDDPGPCAIRAWTPAAGFFIARRPLCAADLVRLDVEAAPTAPVDEATAARLAATPEAPIVLEFDAAVALCERLSRRLGATVTLPTADELECAARGTDGRRYPWGNGLQRLTGHERSPHGIERFAAPVAQWTSSIAAAGTQPLTLGGPGSACCGGRQVGMRANAIRPVLRPSVRRAHEKST